MRHLGNNTGGETDDSALERAAPADLSAPASNSGDNSFQSFFLIILEFDLTQLLLVRRSLHHTYVTYFLDVIYLHIS